MKPYDYAANEKALRDVMGRRLTTGLFEELSDYATAAPAIFKLSNWRKTYVSILDPTGYKQAMVLIGDWDHWMLLVGNPVFKAHLDEWKKEVDCHIKSVAIDSLLTQAKGPTGTAAARFLAEQGYVKKEKKVKEEQAAPEERAGADVKRLGLKRVA